MGKLRATIQFDTKMSSSSLLCDQLEAAGALHLQRGLDGVDGHDADAPESGGEGGGARLDGDGQVVVVQERQHARVGRRVAEPGQRALHEKGRFVGDVSK